MRAAVPAALLAAAFAWSPRGLCFGYPQVVARARALARTAYRPPAPVPAALARLDYDQYREISFRADRALWPDRRFHVEFFAPGYRFTAPVAINVVRGRTVHRVPFERGLFHFGSTPYPKVLPRGIGFAGLRIHFTGYRIAPAMPNSNDEVIAFLGASYFRAKGEGNQYGASARGIAIDTIAAQREEFPRFREFWLRKPRRGAAAVVVYALMDGASATGAYRFRVRPGRRAIVDVRATVFLRKPVAQLGLAPLTSMYMYGTGDHRPVVYLRPAVHDSQGLLIEDRHRRWTWRPLANPKVVSEFTFRLRSPRGFGLMQRDRSFSDYRSVSMAYQARPSVWIRPEGRWGPGHVTLIELPTRNETNDNIVAFWTPDERPAPEHALRLAYRMIWGARGPREPLGRVLGTYSTRRSLHRPVRMAVVFGGVPAGVLPAGVRPTVHLQPGPAGKVRAVTLRRAPGLGGWLLRFTVVSVSGRPVQLRAYLSHGGKALTETWDYVLAPSATAARPARVP